MTNQIGASRRVTVIGAGFSGLVSAYALVRAGFQVDIHESAPSPGGLISTIKLNEGLVETAANAILNSSQVETLFREIALPIEGTSKEARKRYIYRGGKARRWPIGFAATFRLIGFVVRYLSARSQVRPMAFESAHAWAKRVMGEEAGAYLVEAALQGIYAGDPSRMSATLIFGRFFNAKVPNASPKPTLRGSVAPPLGMGQLIEHLETHLRSRGVTIRYNSALALGARPDHPHVVATSATAAAEIVRGITPARAKTLASIFVAPVVTTTAFFSGTDPESRGFGVLFPPREQRKVLGVLKNNFIFKNRVKVGFSETWIAGGAASTDNVIGESDERVLKRIITEREVCFGRTDRIFVSKITRWPKGIPHYSIELEKQVPGLQGLEENVILMGNYLGEIGLSKILERALQLPEQIATDGSWSSPRA